MLLRLVCCGTTGHLPRQALDRSTNAEEKWNTQIERKTFFFFFSSSSSSSSSSSFFFFFCLLQGSTAAEIKKFQTELMTLTRAAQRCEHVCRVMGAAEHEGQLCVIMKEYVESMDALLLRDGTNRRRKRKGNACSFSLFPFPLCLFYQRNSLLICRLPCSPA